MSSVVYCVYRKIVFGAGYAIRKGYVCVPLVVPCAGRDPVSLRLSQSQWDSSSSCQYQTHPVSVQEEGERGRERWM